MATVIGKVFELYGRDRERPFARCWAPNRSPRDVTYGELLRRASAIAERLRAASVRRGEVVVVILREERALMSAWLAPHLVEAVPSLLAWPTPKLRKDYYARSLVALLRSCDARLVVTTSDLVENIARVTDALAGSTLVLVDDDPVADDVIVPPRATLEDPEGVAVLQHSSGSTGLRKGVALSSRAILNQLAAHAEAVRLRPSDRHANWMPLYHDGGLCGGFLQPLVSGLQLSILSPMDWVSDPSLLLKAISADGCTICWMANFAYNYTARVVPAAKLEGVDLSTMRVFVNTAEPVRVASHAAFLERFAPHGLNPLALTTSYGAAENTLAISQSDPDRPVPVDVVDRQVLARDGVAVAPEPGRPSAAMLSSGRPLRNVRLRVVDDRLRDLPERQVGELVIRSDCMLSGYYNRPDLTAQALRDGWYLTGDYGYVADGEVYVTGRKKDLIIVAGHNVYPQDLEFIAEAVEGVHPGRSAAFGVENEALGTEDVVVVVEAEPGYDEATLSRRVGQEIARQSDCFARTVYVVPPMWLVKTSSGKISRAGCKEKFLSEVSDPSAAVRRRPARAAERPPEVARAPSSDKSLDSDAGHVPTRDALPSLVLAAEALNGLLAELLPVAVL